MYILSNIKKDPYDSRDYIFKTPDNLSSLSLPTSVDLRPYAGDIENQGNTNSCVANATVSALEILLSKVNSFQDLSRLFLYYNLREPYPNLNGVDDGAYLRDSFKEVAEHGICSEYTWPFDTNNVNSQPSQSAYQEAASMKCERYERVCGFGGGEINNAYKMKYALAQGYPLIFSIKLGSTFFNLSGDLSTHNYVGVNNDLIGGHGMAVVGYDDLLNAFIVENSWGGSWGDSGYCAIDYQVMVNDLQDCWVCTEFAGHVFEPEFNLNFDPIIFQNEYDNFYYQGTLRTYNKYCYADVSGGLSPVTYKFKDTFGNILQEESENNFFHKVVTIPSYKTTPTEDCVICVIKDSNQPWQEETQYFVTYCEYGQTPNTITHKNLTELYVAYFNSVPDLDGFNYWMNDSLVDNILDMSETFYSIALSDSIIPDNLNDEDFIDLLYNNIFGYSADSAGLQYWGDNLESGSISRGHLTVALINGATAESKIFFDNRVKVAEEYVNIGQDYNLNLIGVDTQTVQEALSLI